MHRTVCLSRCSVPNSYANTYPNTHRNPHSVPTTADVCRYSEPRDHELRGSVPFVLVRVQAAASMR